MRRGILLLACFLLLPPASRGQTSRARSEQFVRKYAARYRISPEVIGAFIDVESGWNPTAVSPKGAIGLMQLMPGTARRFGAYDPLDPEQNIAAGTRFITTLMWEFRGDLRLVAAAYDAPEKWVRRRLLSYSNPDVVAYVAAIHRHYVARCIAARTQIAR